MTRPLVAAVLAAFYASLLLSANAAAQDRTIRLKPGVKVTMTGKTSGAMSAAGGVEGTFSCICSNFQFPGSCTLEHNGASLNCIKAQGDTCNTSCAMTTKMRTGKIGNLMY